MKVNMFSPKSKFGQYNIKYDRLQGKLYIFIGILLFLCVLWWHLYAAWGLLHLQWINPLRQTLTSLWPGLLSSWKISSLSSDYTYIKRHEKGTIIVINELIYHLKLCYKNVMARYGICKYIFLINDWYLLKIMSVEVFFKVVNTWLIYFSVDIKLTPKVNETLTNVCSFGLSSISCDSSDLFRLLTRLSFGRRRNRSLSEKTSLYKL